MRPSIMEFANERGNLLVAVGGEAFIKGTKTNFGIAH
jgi:hypothetical protein